MPDPAALPVVDQLTVYGADWCGDCRRAKRFLGSTGTPYTWVDTAADRAAKAMLNAAGYHAIPVALFPDGTVLVEPSNGELANALGNPASGPVAAVGAPAQDLATALGDPASDPA